MRKKIRLDWLELRDAFADTAGEHRYYLDRETGAVHFFSTYLDNEDEKEDEHVISSDGRYARIPVLPDSTSKRQMEDFIRTLTDRSEQQSLRTATRDTQASESFRKALDQYPITSKLWARYCEEKLDARIEKWLGRVGVEPLD